MSADSIYLWGMLTIKQREDKVNLYHNCHEGMGAFHFKWTLYVTGQFLLLDTFCIQSLMSIFENKCQIKLFETELEKRKLTESGFEPGI